MPRNGRPTATLTRSLNAYAAGAHAALRRRLHGVEERFRAYATLQAEGNALEALERFPTGANEAERLLLGNPDVRAWLVAYAWVEKGASAESAQTLAAAAYGFLRQLPSSVFAADEAGKPVAELEAIKEREQLQSLEAAGVRTVADVAVMTPERLARYASAAGKPVSIAQAEATIAAAVARASKNKTKLDNHVGLDMAHVTAHPWSYFFTALADGIIQGEHLRADRRAVIEHLREHPPALEGDQPVEVVRAFIADAKSDANQRFKEFIDRREIDPDRVADPRVRREILDYLDRLGVQFDAADSDDRYDEWFALAYSQAARTLSTGDDPLQAKFNAIVSDWDFSVDPLDDIERQQVIPKNIKAAGALDYVYELGERLGVFKLVDALVLRWAHGALDIPDGEGATKLYRYWKLRDERSTPEERGLLYRRVLAKGTTRTLSGMVVNEEFPQLWGALMEETVTFIERSESVRREDRGVSKVRIARATKQLQYNLTEFMTGMAQVQTAEIYAQLRDALEILNDDDVVSIVAAGRRRNLWTVIERLSKEEFQTSVNVEALRASASDGNRVFGWLATFRPGAEDSAAFDDLLDAAESYIIAQASIHGDNTDVLDAEDEEFEEDVEDEFGEFDDFGDDF